MRLENILPRAAEKEIVRLALCFVKEIRVDAVPAVVVGDLDGAVVSPCAGVEGGGGCEADLRVL